MLAQAEACPKRDDWRALVKEDILPSMKSRPSRSIGGCYAPNGRRREQRRRRAARVDRGSASQRSEVLHYGHQLIETAIQGCAASTREGRESPGETPATSEDGPGKGEDLGFSYEFKRQRALNSNRRATAGNRPRSARQAAWGFGERLLRIERVSLPMGAKLLDRTIASRISAPSAKSRACPGKDQLPQERRCAVVFREEPNPTSGASKRSHGPKSMTGWR